MNSNTLSPNQHLLFIFLTTVFFQVACIQTEALAMPEDLTSIGLRELMNLDLKVTTATRRKQKVSKTAAALYVITKDDIRRSGARHVAEALRLAPGVEVARIDSNTWAVSIRGINQTFSDLLLVLIDGRIVYTPLFSGTFWETLPVDVNDVERIEVIRGPGASVWGSNAVNGVINIVTKSALSSESARVEVGGGSHERYFHSTAKTTELGEKTAIKLTHQFSSRAENKLESGGRAQDDWSIATGGIRLDSELNAREELTVIADGYYQEEFYPAVAPSFDPPYIDSSSFAGENYNSGANSSLRYKNQLSEDEELRLNTDYIYEKRNSSVLGLRRHSIQGEAIYDRQLFEHTTATSGLGMNWYTDDTAGNFIETLDPESRTTQLYHGFLQLQHHLFDDSVHLLVGTKLEHNDYSGFEVMPTGRLVVEPNDSSSVWFSYSRAASTPGRAFDDTLLPVQFIPGSAGGPDTLVTVEGSNDIESMLLDAYEMGYRKQLSHSFFADIAVFYFDYSQLQGLHMGPPRSGPFLGEAPDATIVPLVFGNRYDAWSYGGELSLDYAPEDQFNLSLFYSYLNLNVSGSDSTLDSEVLLKEGNSPEHSAGLRASFMPLPDVEIDSSLRYVDSLKFGEIPGYWELDARLAYTLDDQTELALVGRDLLHNNHIENQGSIFSPPRIEIERSVWGSIRVTF